MSWYCLSLNHRFFRATYVNIDQFISVRLVYTTLMVVSFYLYVTQILLVLV